MEKEEEEGEGGGGEEAGRRRRQGGRGRQEKGRAGGGRAQESVQGRLDLCGGCDVCDSWFDLGVHVFACISG